MQRHSQQRIEMHPERRPEHMDSLNAFVVFVQVAETRSFVAAGRLLGSPLPPWARAWRAWKKLGVRLFHRSTRSITPTAEGLLLLERSRRILAEIEAAQTELSQASSAPRGRCESACRW
jgi:DNA-binding transcriptional LysR family regulator